MKKQTDLEGTNGRSGLRTRQSVRSLPKGQFQQIRHMFDRSSNPTKNISIASTQTDSSLYSPILPSNQRHTISEHQLFSPMASAINYNDSYQLPSSSSQTTPQYISSLQRTLAVRAKPVVVRTTYHLQKPTESITNPSLYQSVTSLSSTGYESNSSPSMISKRNSLVINHGHDLSLSSTDDQQRLKSWIFDESGLGTLGPIGNSFSSDDVFDSCNESSPSILKHRPSNASKNYMVQTTTFPQATSQGEVVFRLDTPNFRRRYPFGSTSSTGFQMGTSTLPRQRSSLFTPILVQKCSQEREEILSTTLPPRKPPRTFEHETRYESFDRKVPSPPSSDSDSPSFELGARSVSCMDLTVGVLNKRLPFTDHQQRSSTLPDKIHENIYEELKPSIPRFNQSQASIDQSFVRRPGKGKEKKRSSIPLTSSPMKKGVSEPNLTKQNDMKSSSTSLFSPRAFLNRMRRFLPISLSKQSLNEKSSANSSTMATMESDDSTSTTSSSDNTDELRLSRLDHVNRVKHVYDSLSSSSPVSSLFSDTLADEFDSLYAYVVHLLPEQDFGYFSNGTGCLSSLNLHSSSSSLISTSVRFKYPFNATDEVTLKYFCFPDSKGQSTPTRSLKPEYFRFTLTDTQGRRQHGYCSRFVRKGILNALCLISPCDLIEFYEKILSTATELFLSYKDEDARQFLIEIYPHRLPTRGDTIYIPTNTVGLYTLHCEYDRRKPLIDSMTLLSLSTDTIIKIFSSILYEQKLIFIGTELGPLTRLINTFLCLLYPFSWPHTYIPILPTLMLDVMQAPTPYIIGILRSCEHYLIDNREFVNQDYSDILIVDIDEDRLRSMADYHSTENLRSPASLSSSHILPKLFKLELKQELSALKKNKSNLSSDECQQRLREVFMSIFVQSSYNYQDYLHRTFDVQNFIQSKTRAIAIFLEWFTRTQIFQLFIRKKQRDQPFAFSFDFACETFRRTLTKPSSAQRITAKSVKRKAASRAQKQDQRL